MKKRARRNHSPAFKAKVALSCEGDRTLAQISEQFDIHVNQIMIWKDQLLEGAAEVFERSAGGKRSAPPVDIKVLRAKIGELTLENFFRGCARQSWVAQRKAMIDTRLSLGCSAQLKFVLSSAREPPVAIVRYRTDQIRRCSHVGSSWSYLSVC